MTETLDVLIVVGGSAGAVLANRLSEDGTRRILLLEAGSAYSPNLYPPDLANADIVGGPGGHDWGYVGATGIGDRPIRALRGKVLGASSAVNAAVAIRARAAAETTRTGCLYESDLLIQANRINAETRLFRDFADLNTLSHANRPNKHSINYGVNSRVKRASQTHVCL